MAEQSLTSSFMAPLWWIRAFELALQWRRLDVDPGSMSQATGLSPALTEVELNALLVILRVAQQQILLGQKWLTFPAESLQKNNAANGRTRNFLFLRLLQMLRSIQIAPPAHQEAGEPILLFEKEERRRDSQGNWKTMYRLAPMAAELMLGYGEPYAELTRLLEGKPRVHRHLGQHQPLSLRPSVWLDLLHLEQYIFLQLQKASYWEKSRFRWDAVFGRTFDSLFSGIELSGRKGEELSPFSRKMRLLTRVGRKLVDQGVLKHAQDLDYFAVDQEGDPLAVIWQLHDSESRDREARHYENRCARYFREQSLETSIKKIIPVLQANGNTTIEAAHQLWKEIDEADKNLALGHLRIEGNLLLSITAIFFEWSVRKPSDDILRLPGWLRECAAIQAIDAPRPLVERLQNFAQIIQDQPEYHRDLEQLPRATLASPLSLRQREVLELLASHSLKNSGSREMQVSQASEPSTTPQALRTAPRHPTPLSGTANRKTFNDAEMRKQASDELLKMRERDPKRYSGLKQQYLDNLENEKKQIILEMKERMQPQAFDDHLKYSLVKYMLDNPRLWQSEERIRP